MVLVQGIDAIFSLQAKKRFGNPCPLGHYQPGFFRLGQSEEFFAKGQLGEMPVGKIKFGDIIVFSGIFQVRRDFGKQKTVRLRYQVPKNPQTETQQANRKKMQDGVPAWRALTNEERAVYNIRSRGKKLSGYNLFLSEYFRSH